MSEIEIMGGVMDHYTQIPNEIFRNPSLKSRAVHVFGNLRSNRSGWKTSIRNVAASTGLNKETVMNAIHDLMDAGYITRTPVPGKNGQFDTYKYQVYDVPRPENPDRPDPSGKSVQAPSGNSGQGTVRKIRTHKKNSSKKNSKNNPPVVPQGDEPAAAGGESDSGEIIDAEIIPDDTTPAPTTETGGAGGQLALVPDTSVASQPEPTKRKGGSKRTKLRTDYTPEFEQFWEIYPGIREGKVRAFDRWLHAVQDGATPEQLIEGAKRAAMFHQVKGTDRQFIRRAIRWFDERGWEDELHIDRSTDRMSRSTLDRLHVQQQQARAQAGGYGLPPTNEAIAAAEVAAIEELGEFW